MSRKARGERGPTRRRRDAGEAEWPSLPPSWLVPFLLGALVVAAYANCASEGFVLDASAIVRDNPRTWSLSLESLYRTFAENYWYPVFYTNTYRPLTTLSYSLNAALAGWARSPLPFQAVNVLLHWLNVTLAWRLARAIVGDGWRALFIAAVLAVHPLTVESVTNIVGRADLLAALGILAGMLAHVRSLRGPAATRAGWRGLLALAGLLAVWSKESGAVLVALVAWYDLCFDADGHWEAAHPFDPRLWLRRVRTTTWPSYVALVPSLFVMLVSRRLVLADSPAFQAIGADNPLAAADFWSAKMTALTIVGRYLGLLFWPSTLSCSYSYNQIPIFTWGWRTRADWFGWLMLGFLPLLGWRLVVAGRRHRPLLFFAGFGAIAFLPVSNLIFATGTVMAERFMYLPVLAAAGVVACAAPLVTERSRRGWDGPWRDPRLAVVVAVAILSLLTMRTAVRNRDWANELSLWQAAVRATPNNFAAYTGVGDGYRAVYGMEESLDQFIDWYGKGIAVFARSPLPPEHMPIMVYWELARALLYKGDLIAGGTAADSAARARRWYERALAIAEQAVSFDRRVADLSRADRLRRGVPPQRVYDAGNGPLHLGYANILERLGRTDEATREYEYARQLSPGDPQVQIQSAEFCQRRGNEHDAVIRFLQAMLLLRDNPEAVQVLSRRVEEIYRRLDPTFTTLAEALRDGDGAPAERADLAQAVDDLTTRLAQVGHGRDARLLREAAATIYPIARGRSAGEIAR